MAIDADASLRVVVSGLLKRKAGLEDDLRCFFHDVGCKVAAVRLVVDPKRAGRNRGFSFVDLEDHESLDLALKLHNQEAKGLADNDANLRVAKAHDGTDQAMKRKQGFSDARKQLRRENGSLPFLRPGSTNFFNLGRWCFASAAPSSRLGNNWTHHNCFGEKRQHDR